MARGIAYYYEGHRVLITDRRGVKYVCDCENCEYKGGSDRCKSCVFDEVRVLPISSGRLSFNLLRSFYQCVKIMQRYPSCLFFGCGAYVSFISGMAAALCGREIQIYQGDQIPGLANRILQYFASKSWVSSSKIELKNKQVVGCIARHYMRRESMKNDGEFRLLIAGSSVGSSLLYGIMPAVVMLLSEETRAKLRIVHQVRKEHQEYLKYMYDKVGVKYEISEFVNTKKELPKAHFVICRAGWSLISDVIATGRAAFFIPWEGASKNHQYHNALDATQFEKHPSTWIFSLSKQLNFAGIWLTRT